MKIMLSAQGNDINSWRAVEGFAAAYRQTLLDLAASESCGGAEMLFMETSTALDAIIATNRQILEHLNGLIDNVSRTPSSGLKELTASFYRHLYRHFEQFNSTTAFYQMSMAYLQKVSSVIISRTTDQLGDSSHNLPEITLIAAGPAGRGEYSPYCSLQILLVHADISKSQMENVVLFCDMLHIGFEDSGLAVDPIVTPRNPEWRGTLTEWRERCFNRLELNYDKEIINLCRFVDLYPLYHAEGFALELKRSSNAALGSSHSAVASLIKRITALTNGLSLMGRLKLERSGSDRGLFRLLDHGLLPLSAALSALALIKGCRAVTNCERIRELLNRGELDVEMAERMLATWHTLHGLRLKQEQAYIIDQKTDHLLCLNPNELAEEQQLLLIEALESVATVQRHIGIIFSGIEE